MSSHQPAASVVANEKRVRLRRRRRLLIAAGVVAGFVLFAFFGLPPIVRAQAVKHLSAALHREVAIGKIRINPLVLSVTVEDLAIKDRDGGPFTGWKRLYVNFDSFSLFKGELHFQQIELEGFSQRVAIAKDGTFNFADLIPPPADKPAAPVPGKPRPVRVTELKITDASLYFSDDSRAQRFHTLVGPMSFELHGFVTRGDPKAPYAFSAVTEAGESLSWKGTVGVDPVRSAGSFGVGHVKLGKYLPYYESRLNADLLDGLLDVDASYDVEFSAENSRLLLRDARVALSRLKVAARGSTQPLVDLPSLVIEGLSADALKPSAVVRRVALDGGRLVVVREADGSVNLLNLLPKPAASAPATTASPSAAAPAALPDVKLDELSIAGLSVAVEDRTTSAPAKITAERIDFSARHLSLSEGAAPVAVRLGVAFAPGGRVEVSGDVAREPLSANLAVKIDAFPLAGVTPYVEPFINLRIAGGAVSVDGVASLRDGVAGFSGGAGVDKFLVVDGKAGEDFVKFTRLAIGGIEATSRPLAAKIGSIELVDPLARVAVYPDKTTNLSAILRSGPAPAPAPAPSVPAAPVPVSPAAPAPVWSLGKFTLVNGRVVFSDGSIKPAARLALDQFSGTVTGLSSDAPDRADVAITGKFNGTGRIAVAGKLDARAVKPVPGAFTDITVDVKGVDLSAISPYVGTYAGYELARSGLVVDVKARLTERRLDTANVVTLNQFTLGAPTSSPDAIKLPVRLAVALLKDIDGNIVIDLPVKGSLDDPEFKIGRVVLNVLTNLLLKAATSPFSLIGSMFGGGGDDLAFQLFEPGATSPAESETGKLDTLRKALKGRPALNLDITGSYDAEADLAAVRMKTLDRQVRHRRWEELRAANPETPPPAEIVVSHEDEIRIVGLFLAERFPAGLPAGPEHVAVATPETALKAALPAPAPAKKTVAMRPARRPGNVFGGRPEPVERPVPKPVALAPADAPAAEGAAPAPTLADARRMLAATIPVETDQLRALADERAQTVRTALLSGGEIDESRLLLTPPAAEPKGARVLLQLR